MSVKHTPAYTTFFVATKQSPLRTAITLGKMVWCSIHVAGHDTYDVILIHQDGSGKIEAGERKANEIVNYLRPYNIYLGHRMWWPDVE